jgi:hypothetical protein
VQRLLLEGMKLVADEPRLPSSASALEAMQFRAANQLSPFAARDGVQSEAVQHLQDEVFGHLAVALRTEMICAADERLKVLIAPRFLQTTGIAFILCKCSQGTVSRVTSCYASCTLRSCCSDVVMYRIMQESSVFTCCWSACWQDLESLRPTTFLTDCWHSDPCRMVAKHEALRGGLRGAQMRPHLWRKRQWPWHWSAPSAYLPFGPLSGRSIWWISS